MISELEMGKAESELELGLGLSLGGGTAAKIGKPGGGGAWGERGRLLTAKDFPSVGSKRAADSASHAGASPPRSSCKTSRIERETKKVTGFALFSTLRCYRFLFCGVFEASIRKKQKLD
ncbi:hypothetical protein F2Q69_00011383 [Brassica cretica]|uniref:Uncharacterized protein n=1 Tax=Brassica cretica TaxID=69181 RepID=A0A8S9QYT8_BRACR|nr:hypothetical protein F2Q69_00011383 [Brassica cretica]